VAARCCGDNESRRSCRRGGHRGAARHPGSPAPAPPVPLLLIYLVLAALFESLLLPVIIYFSIFFAPMGRAVIGDLATSLVLTLTLTPVLYAWIDDVGRWLEDVWAGMRAAARAPRVVTLPPEVGSGD
jgi:hypothetical protein